jgi:hypothetical protein
MLASGTVIKTTMNKRGFRHRRTEDQFSLRGEYARNTQFVYSKEYKTKQGLVVDLIYFAVDIMSEKLVIGLYRENPEIDNGILINTSRAINLPKFDADEIGKILDKLIPPVKDKFK